MNMTENAPSLPSSVAILGSTGSVGRQALEVAAHHGIPVDYISAHSSLDLLEEQVRAFRPRLCAVADEDAAADLRVRIADTPTRVLSGKEGILTGITETTAPVVVNSILGEAGLLPTLATIDAGKRLALANKESLVVAGQEVMRRAREKGVEILPVDSAQTALLTDGNFEAAVSAQAVAGRYYFKILAGEKFVYVPVYVSNGT